MIGTIRRHQTWLWVIIATLTVASFLIFGPTNSRIGDALGGRNANLGMLDGKPIDVDHYVDARKEAYLRYFLNNQQWPDRDPNAKKMGFDEARETYYRLLLISKINELGIKASDDAVAERVAQVIGPLPYEKLTTDILAPEGMTSDDFRRFIRHELGLQQLYAVTGLSGSLVTPQEAEQLYRKEHRNVAASIVFLSATNFISQVKVTPAALTQFYNDRQANYRIPTRAQVDYVKYNLSNYLAEAKTQLTNLDALVDQNYIHNGTNLYREAKTPEEAKAKVRQDLLLREASIFARRAASEFAVDLDKMEPRRADNLAALARERKLTVQTTEPFNEEDGPTELNVPNTFARAAFKLTAEDPFAGPIEGDDAVFVIAMNKTIPSEIPALTNIEAKVTADYQMAEAAQLARTTGTNFANAAAIGLASGKSFEVTAAAAGLRTEALPPFSLSTRSLPSVEDRVNFGVLKQVAFGIQPGTVSPFIPSRDGGIVVYTQSLLPIDEDKLKKEMPEFLAYVRQMRQSDAFNQWFSAQVNRDPGFKQTLEAAGNSQMRNANRPKS